MPYSRFNFLHASCLLLALLALFYLSACSEPSSWQQHDQANTASIDHQAWQEILDEYLIDDDNSGINLVDYESIAEEALTELDSYLNAMAAIDIGQYNRREQFAYWVNLYNAITVHLVAKNYPVESIKDISESVLPLGPWDDVVVEVAGRPLTLNDIEHQILRLIWQDYRVHFAVNCASLACPNLRRQVFTANNTEALLNQSADEYIQHTRGFEIIGEKLMLSSIFDWYQQDFGVNEEAMLVTLGRHFSVEQKDALKTFKGEIEYHYDWALNGVD